MDGKKPMHYNQNKRIYQYLSEYHFLYPLHRRQNSILPQALKIELSNLTTHCSCLEERIIKLDKVIEDVKRLIETKKRSDI